MSDKHWMPEIVYEEMDDGLTSRIPFISVPEEEKMPHLIYIFESRDTGEIEPGPEGEDLPVTEITLHQYADMELLKKKLTPIEYDNVRRVLELGPFADATKKGQQISQNIREKLENPTNT
tara:strand:- start:152 stop:511 length:360 start_codon:yes stop_codon:yes gene_type:complete